MKTTQSSNIVNIAEKYTKDGRIPRSFMDDMADLIDSSTLRIGIIGKMKAGKSSLVNALFFHKTVLPTGIKPMTVTLTEITYGDEERVTVELLDEKDLTDLQVATQSDNGAIKEEAQKILLQIKQSTIAQQLIAEKKSSVNISLEQLKEYVAVGGALSGLAKRVTICLPHEGLKGITIIDTPGFNDPVISRGEKTKECLSQCHVLLYVHDISDQYDDTELSLVQNQITYDGISKIIDVVNKIDKLSKDEYPIQKWGDFISSFVKHRNEVVQKLNDDSIIKTISNAQCVWFSPLMALLGSEKPLSEKSSTQILRFRDKYPEIKCQEDLFNYSNYSSLLSEIESVLAEKDSILSEGPRLTLSAKLKAIKLVIEEEITTLKAQYNTLCMTQSEIQAKKENFEREIAGIIQYIQSTELKYKLLVRVNECTAKIIDRRRILADERFSDALFLDPGLFGSQKKKENNGTYNNVLYEMCEGIRNILASLKNMFDIEATQVINDTKSKIYGTSLSQDNRDEIEAILRQSLLQVIANIPIIVSTEQISSTPSGRLLASELYKAEFMKLFSDDKIAEYLSPFKATAEDIKIQYIETAKAKIQQVYDNICAMEQFDPSRKDVEKNNINSQIAIKESELVKVEEDIKTLESPCQQ